MSGNSIVKGLSADIQTPTTILINLGGTAIEEKAC
jgi:hypothetical protein